MSAKITDADRAAAHALVDAWYLSKAAVFGEPGDTSLSARVAQAIADARNHQRRIDAAHAFDRAEQYDHSSGIYDALTQVAASLAEGAAEEADQHGEFEPELMARVDRIAARRTR